MQRRRKNIYSSFSWSAFLSQLVVIAGVAMLIRQMRGVPDLTVPLLYAFALYFIYGPCARLYFLPDHVRGMRFFRKGQFREAIQSFERSERHLLARPWIDRNRWILVLSSSAITYLEIAMYNIAAAQLQLGQESLARRSLTHFLDVAPGSPLAKRVRAALSMLGNSGKKKK